MTGLTGLTGLTGPVPVLAAVSGASWEAALVSALERTPAGITVVRRCVDLPDLLAAATTGTARGVLLSAGLRRLDRNALSRLAVAQVAVVGLVTPGDAEAESRLRRLGVATVLPADSAPADISTAMAGAIALLATSSAVDDVGWSRPLSALDGGPPPESTPVAAAPVGAGTGRLVAVWGPTGAPGRTTVAVNLAAELAAAGATTLLADADVYGGVVAQVLGFLDEAPGLAAVARLANNGRLDLGSLARAAPEAAPRLRVLTGISRAERWPELRASALEQVWSLARSLAAMTVVDLGFCLERDEELSFDVAAPRRNGATLATLEDADTVLAVGSGDPVGIQRLVRGLAQLVEVAPEVVPRVVVTRVRRGPVGHDPGDQIAAALERYAGVHEVVVVPDDRDACDTALLQARALVDVRPDSPARLALAALAAELWSPADRAAGPSGSRRRTARSLLRRR